MSTPKECYGAAMLRKRLALTFSITLVFAFLGPSAISGAPAKARYRSSKQALQLAQYKHRNLGSSRKIDLHGDKAYARPLLNPNHVSSSSKLKRELQRRAANAGYPKSKWVDFAIRNLNSGQEIGHFMKMMTEDLEGDTLDDLYEDINSVVTRERHVPGTDMYWSAGMTNRFRVRIRADQAIKRMANKALDELKTQPWKRNTPEFVALARVENRSLSEIEKAARRLNLDDWGTSFINPKHLVSEKAYREALKRAAKRSGYERQEWREFAVRNLRADAEVFKFLEYFGTERSTEFYSAVSDALKNRQTNAMTRSYWEVGIARWAGKPHLIEESSL